MIYLITRLTDWIGLRGYRIFGDTYDGFYYKDGSGKILYIGRDAGEYKRLNLRPSDLLEWTKPKGELISNRERQTIVKNLKKSMKWEGIEVVVCEE